MKSGFKIIWSDEAKNNLSWIINYLEINWTEKELRFFFQGLEKTFQLISQNPQLFRLTNKRKKFANVYLVNRQVFITNLRITKFIS